MAYWMILSDDKDHSIDIRLQHRDAHLAYVSNKGDNRVTQVALGAPLGQDVMNGSLIIVEAESLDNVEDFAANDPYELAGLFDSIIIKPLHANFNADKFLK